MNNDPEVSPYLKVVMLRNYNVSMAEKLIPASDISEQISLASKEASGTGNMKFMLNGAVTLGTMDGANVEIAELVGEDNIFTFGQSSEEVIEHYKNADYVAKNWYKKDKRLAAAVDFLVSEEMLEAGDRKLLQQLYDELLGKDWFMTFPDFESYWKTKDKSISPRRATSPPTERSTSTTMISGIWRKTADRREQNIVQRKPPEIRFPGVLTCPIKASLQ